MNVRPRCCKWLPLSTQQLRLRNLESIQGINIDCQLVNDCPTEILLYYTLHHQRESQAFYQSEPLPYRNHMQQKWAEIQCLTLLKSNANCVCVKVWAKLKTDFLHKNIAIALNSPTKHVSALTHPNTNTNEVEPHDKLLFSWAVYFSGLIPIAQLTENKCQANCLIFQMSNGYFTSPDYFTTDNLREELSLKYERYAASDLKSSPLPMDENIINSPHVSRSSSPINMDWRQNLLLMAKMRYNQINFKKNDVKISYNLEKLLRLQQLQRLRLRTEGENVELMEQIKRVSVRCISKEQLSRKPQYNYVSKNIMTLSSTAAATSTSSTTYAHTSIGRTLSMLLAAQQRIDPYKLLKAQQLQQQLETLHSKQRLLLQSCNSYAKRVTILKEKLCTTTTIRQQLDIWLKQQQRKLESDIHDLKASVEEICSAKKRKHLIMQHIKRRMSTLCIELQQIYPIARNQEGFHTVCNVPYPTLELGYFEYDFVRSTGGTFLYADNTSPLALGVVLGYVAHLVQIMAAILNRPLRNPLIHEGSRSRIVDAIKEIPGTSREFPLYSRSVLPTNSVKNAVYLLNQNITQLCYDITGNIYKRPVLENILHIYKMLCEIQQQKSNVDEEEKQQSSTLGNSLEKKCPLTNSSTDTTTTTTQTTTIATLPHVPTLSLSKDKKLSMEKGDFIHSSEQNEIINRSTKRRICRSVGSYTDSEEECRSTQLQYYSYSDTNLITNNS